MKIMTIFASDTKKGGILRFCEPWRDVSESHQGSSLSRRTVIRPIWQKINDDLSISRRLLSASIPHNLRAAGRIKRGSLFFIEYRGKGRESDKIWHRRAQLSLLKFYPALCSRRNREISCVWCTENIIICIAAYRCINQRFFFLRSLFSYLKFQE